jgi:hypothetical protein
MGELGKDWARGVVVTAPVTRGGGNYLAWPLGQFKNWGYVLLCPLSSSYVCHG